MLCIFSVDSINILISKAFECHLRFLKKEWTKVGEVFSESLFSTSYFWIVWVVFHFLLILTKKISTVFSFVCCSRQVNARIYLFMYFQECFPKVFLENWMKLLMIKINIELVIKCWSLRMKLHYLNILISSKKYLTLIDMALLGREKKSFYWLGILGKLNLNV